MSPKKKKSLQLPHDDRRRFPTLAILFGIFLVMLGIVFLLNKGDSEQNLEKSEKFFLNFDSKNVVRIEIQGPKSEMVQLAQVNGKWVVESKGNYAADDSLISDAFTMLSSLRSGTLVSKNPEKQEEMGISDTAGLHVTFLKKDSAPVLDFFLGNRGPVMQSQYVRLADRPEVYLFSESLDFYFDKAEWRNKSILGLSSEDIAEFAIKSPSGKTSYVMDEKLESAPDSEKVKSLAADVANLSALSFAENDEVRAIDFENRSDAVKLWVKTRQDAIYIVYFVKDNEMIYAKRADGVAVFTVAEAVYDAFSD